MNTNEWLDAQKEVLQHWIHMAEVEYRLDFSEAGVIAQACKNGIQTKRIPLNAGSINNFTDQMSLMRQILKKYWKL